MGNHSKYDSKSSLSDVITEDDAKEIYNIVFFQYFLYLKTINDTLKVDVSELPHKDILKLTNTLDNLFIMLDS